MVALFLFLAVLILTIFSAYLWIELGSHLAAMTIDRDDIKADRDRCLEERNRTLAELKDAQTTIATISEAIKDAQTINPAISDAIK